MNNHQRKTLEAIFARPVPTSLNWNDLESLFLAVGASKAEGSGSRVRFTLGQTDIFLHRPHNPSILKPYQVRLAREFFEKAGIRP